MNKLSISTTGVTKRRLSYLVINEIAYVRKNHNFFQSGTLSRKTQKKSYFEGWYYKIIDVTEKFAFAVIPAISIDSNGEKHAFIQVLDEKN